MGIIGMLLAAAVAGQAPAELVGEWAMAEGSNPSASYRIGADGRFTYSSSSVTVSPGCDTRVIATAEGQVSVEGSLLHLDSVTASFRSVNTCRPKWDYEKPGQAGRNSFRWRIEREASGPVLVLHQRSGLVQRYIKR